MASEFPAGPFRATLTSRRALANGIVDLKFVMQEPPWLNFRAGQFVSFHVGRDAAGLPARRSYSIASPSHTGDVLRFIVRVIPTGAASDYLSSIPIGTEVPMTGPHGFFVLEASHPGDVVFGATGTGTAAVLPMLAELATRPTLEQRTLFWGARHADDLFARDEIEQLCTQARTSLHICLTSPPTIWDGARGRITPAILAAFEEWKTPTFYLVGNGAMIGQVKKELLVRGVDRKKQIRTEAFFD
jgi:ferredoxin-NADP reductase